MLELALQSHERKKKTISPLLQRTKKMRLLMKKRGLLTQNQERRGFRFARALRQSVLGLVALFVCCTLRKCQ